MKEEIRRLQNHFNAGKKEYFLYDPFMGTGTTAVAFEAWGGLNWIGSEISEKQVEFANTRLKYGIVRENVDLSKYNLFL